MGVGFVNSTEEIFCLRLVLQDLALQGIPQAEEHLMMYSTQAENSTVS